MFFWGRLAWRPHVPRAREKAGNFIGVYRPRCRSARTGPPACSQVQGLTAPAAVPIVGASVPRAAVRIEGACPVKRAGHHATGSPLATLDARAAG